MQTFSYFFILFCACWNILYVSFSAALGIPVLRIGRLAVAHGIELPSIWVLPLFIWLLYGLARRQYAAWIVGFGPAVWFGFGIFGWIGCLIGGGVIPHSTSLEIIGLIAVVLNLAMGIFMLLFRDLFEK